MHQPKYKFMYLPEEGEKLIMVLDAEKTATEVLRNFLYFLQGCSFHKDTLNNALRDLVEMDDAPTEP